MDKNRWGNAYILITGVCGTVGRELLRQLSQLECARILGLDNNESELFFLSQTYAKNENIRFFLGDLRDRDKMIRKMRGIDIVLHAAALKHVILCEESPRDAVYTNIMGMINVIDAAEINHVKRVIFTSSDKAVNPTNVMGTTKLMGERLITAANAQRRNHTDTVFSSTRFGNVLASRGSVEHLFKRQIAHGGPVTLTHPEMTRFIMTLEEAVRLVMETVFLAMGGEVFVTKMPVVWIKDLAKAMIDLLAPQYGYKPKNIEVKLIGSKPGEKLFEELLNEEEVRRTLELPNYYAILPAFKSVYQRIDYKYDGIISDKVHHPYNSRSESALSSDDIKRFLIRHKVLEEEDRCVC